MQPYLLRKQEEGVLTRLVWPSQSPDLNPIKLVWEEMDHRILKEKPTSEAHLLQNVHDVWNNLTENTLKKLVEHISRLIQAVIN